MILKEALALLKVQAIRTDHDVQTARKNYIELIRKWHPDRNPDNLIHANKMTDDIVQAWRLVQEEAQKLPQNQSHGGGFGQSNFEAECKDFLKSINNSVWVEHIYQSLIHQGIQSWKDMAQKFKCYQSERELQCALIALGLGDGQTRFALKMIFRSDKYKQALDGISNPDLKMPAAVFVNEIVTLLTDKAGSEISCYVVANNIINLGITSWDKFKAHYPTRDALDFDFTLTRGAQINQSVMVNLLWEHINPQRHRAEQERAERFARERAAREQEERERAERFAWERAAREQEERERAERFARERSAREQEERERAERSNHGNFFAAERIILPGRTAYLFRDIENLLKTNGINDSLSRKIAYDPLFASTQKWEFMHYIFTNIQGEADLFFMFASHWAGYEEMSFSEFKRISQCFAATPEFKAIMQKSETAPDFLGKDLMKVNSVSGPRLAYNLAKIGVTSWPLLCVFLKGGDGSLQEKFARYQLWDGIPEPHQKEFLKGIEGSAKLKQASSVVNVARGKYWASDFEKLLIANGLEEELAKHCSITLAREPYQLVSWYAANYFVNKHSDGNALFLTLVQALGQINGIKAIHLQQIVNVFASQKDMNLLSPQVTELKIPSFACNPPKDKILSWEQLGINLARAQLFNGYALKSSFGMHRTVHDLSAAMRQMNAWTGHPGSHREALAETLFNALHPGQDFRPGR